MCSHKKKLSSYFNESACLTRWNCGPGWNTNKISQGTPSVWAFTKLATVDTKSRLSVSLLLCLFLRWPTTHTWAEANFEKQEIFTILRKCWREKRIRVKSVSLTNLQTCVQREFLSIWILPDIFVQRMTNIVMFIVYYPSARDVDYIQSLDRLLGTSAAGLIFARLCLSCCHIRELYFCFEHCS